VSLPKCRDAPTASAKIRLADTAVCWRRCNVVQLMRDERVLLGSTSFGAQQNLHHYSALLSVNDAAMSALHRWPPLICDVRHGRYGQCRRRRVQRRGRCLSQHASTNGRRMRGASCSRRTHAQQWICHYTSASAADAMHGCNATARLSGTDRQRCSRQLGSTPEAALPQAWLRPSTEVEMASSGCKQVICHRTSADTGREVRHHTAGSGRSAHRRVRRPADICSDITQGTYSGAACVQVCRQVRMPIPLCHACRYTDTGFLVNDVTVSGSLLCLRDLWMRWDVSSVAGVTPDSIAMMFLLRPFPGESLTNLKPRPQRAAKLR